MKIAIKFYRDARNDSLFVTKLLHFLTSRGIRYNARKRGRYLIIGERVADEISQSKNEIGEATEKFAEIGETYRQYDSTKTSLTISVDYMGEPSFSFEVAIIPLSDDDKTMVSFISHTNEITTEEMFVQLVDICKAVFTRFDFVYGMYQNENHQGMTFVREDVAAEPPEAVTFYSSDVAEDIGRNRLLSAPAQTVEELDNGGVFLLACPSVIGSCEELADVREHLGFDRIL